MFNDLIQPKDFKYEAIIGLLAIIFKNPELFIITIILVTIKAIPYIKKFIYWIKYWFE